MTSPAESGLSVQAQAFLSAAKTGNRGIIEQHLAEININVQDENLQTALIVATVAGRTRIAKMLLEQSQIEINTQDDTGRTAFHYAALHGRNDILSMLAGSSSVDANIKDQEGKTALFLSLEESRSDVASFLLDIPSVECLPSNTGVTCGMLACMNGDSEIVDQMRTNKEGSLDFNANDQDGNTCLTYACDFVYIDIAHTLLEDVNLESLYFDAVRTGQLSVVRFLFEECNMDINLVDDDARSALILASKEGKEDIVKLVFDRDMATEELFQKVRVNLQDTDGKSALIFACEGGHIGIARMLLGRKDIYVDPYCLRCATSLELLKLLISVVAVNLADKDGLTALMYACKEGRAQCTELLLEQSETAVNQRDHAGKSALTYACESGSAACVHMLINHDSIDINLQDEQGKSPLFYASEAGYTKVCESLLEIKETDVNSKSKEGLSALMVASCEGRVAVVAAFLGFDGIDVNLQAECGRTALMFACGSRRVKVVESLLQSADIDIQLKSKDDKTAQDIAAEETDIITLLTASTEA